MPPNGAPCPFQTSWRATCACAVLFLAGECLSGSLCARSLEGLGNTRARSRDEILFIVEGVYPIAKASLSPRIRGEKISCPLLRMQVETHALKLCTWLLLVYCLFARFWNVVGTIAAVAPGVSLFDSARARPTHSHSYPFLLFQASNALYAATMHSLFVLCHPLRKFNRYKDGRGDVPRLSS
jgi:hypothetical protein